MIHRVLAAFAVVGIVVVAVGALASAVSLLGDVSAALSLGIALVTMVVVVSMGLGGTGSRTPYW